MDSLDEKILDLMQGNARITYQELGDAIGMSRVAAKKRVLKLEKDGVICGYSARVCRPDEVTMFIDIVTVPGKYEDVLKAVQHLSPCIRQIFKTTKEDHIHIVAVSDEIRDLRRLTGSILKKSRSDIAEIECHAVKEVIRDI